MPADDPGPEWVLLPLGVQTASDSLADNTLLLAARAAWPLGLAYSRRELRRHGIDSEEDRLATEVWENVLRSVSKTRNGPDGHQTEISDLQAYLLGTFSHRFNRALKKELRREKMMFLVSSLRELDAFSLTSRSSRQDDPEAERYAKEILGWMDHWSRSVWVRREYGFSWNQIGKQEGLPDYVVMLRFRRRMALLRLRLLRLG
jgi:hypothetical protein